MTDDKMIEAVARAICAEKDPLGTDDWRGWIGEAEAALCVVREGQWQDISRPPEEGVEVLVCYDEPFFGKFTQEVEIAYYSDGAWFHAKGNGVEFDFTITAWQPLPTPPKE